MSLRNLTISVLVLLGIFYLSPLLLPISYNTYVVTWKQPTEDPRPIQWPINYPYWIKATYPNTGYHTITAVVKGTKESVLENIINTYPEANNVQITFAPYFQLPTNWVYPDWWNDKEWNLNTTTTKPNLQQ